MWPSNFGEEVANKLLTLDSVNSGLWHTAAERMGVAMTLTMRERLIRETRDVWTNFSTWKAFDEFLAKMDEAIVILREEEL